MGGNKCGVTAGDKEGHLYSFLSRVTGTVVNLSRGGGLGWKRKEQVIMTTRRTGHTNLNGKLNVIGKHPTGLSQACQQPQTVQHVLISCRRYTAERGDVYRNKGHWFDRIISWKVF